jgi:hypothetical protein
MPFFKTTQNILVDGGEYFDPNWMDSDKLILPPYQEWDYSRELRIEDVNLWEVLYQQGGGFGIFASWDPYAEFYIIRVGFEKESNGHGIETYYGAGASNLVFNRAKELGIDLMLSQHWVEPEKMWLFENPKQKIIFDSI